MVNNLLSVLRGLQWVPEHAHGDADAASVCPSQFSVGHRSAIGGTLNRVGHRLVKRRHRLGH